VPQPTTVPHTPNFGLLINVFIYVQACIYTFGYDLFNGGVNRSACIVFKVMVGE
jgi:hypothetical protein